MGNLFNDDFRDFIKALQEKEVRYLLVGGYAVILHGYSRTTGYMDIWVENTKENYQKLALAFQQFGMPLFDMTEENFLNHPIWDVYTYGLPPSAIDIMMRVKGLDFNTCYEQASEFEVDGLIIKTINRHHLIQAKLASQRHKDLDDIQNLDKN